MSPTRSGNLGRYHDKHRKEGSEHRQHIGCMFAPEERQQSIAGNEYGQWYPLCYLAASPLITLPQHQRAGDKENIDGLIP